METSNLSSPVTKATETASISNDTTPSISSRHSEIASLGKSQGLTVTGIPVRIRKVDYAVRGRIAIRANELAKDLTNKPFKKLIPCHIGNPMALGMQSLTYIRQTVSLMACPDLLERSDEELKLFYAIDNIARARRYSKLLTSVGAYTESLGAEGLRNEVANFFERRDGKRPAVNSIMITNGASEGINTMLTCLVSQSTDGILLPVPQYPLYSAVITKLGGTILPCYLNEDEGWSLTLEEIKRAFDDAIMRGINPKAIVCISPGNPAPCFLDKDQILNILKFAQDKNLLVIADEVYQDNVYHPEKRPFVSFRSVLLKHGLNTQLASVHSSSKGFYGECGFRGGCTQFENIDDKALAIVMKMRSVELCSNVLGQVVITCVTNPPQPGDHSYDLYNKERDGTMYELRTKADMMDKFFNSLTGTSCQPIPAALYAFPKIDFSAKAIAEAEERGLSVEQFYCLELLESTGIVTSNGDGFGQVPGTHHIRLAFLPRLKDFGEGLERYREFHEDFMKKWN